VLTPERVSEDVVFAEDIVVDKCEVPDAATRKCVGNFGTHRTASQDDNALRAYLWRGPAPLTHVRGGMTTYGDRNDWFFVVDGTASNGEHKADKRAATGGPRK
jgi:hypothetical protein